MLTYPIEWIFVSVLKSFAVPADFQFFSIWHSGRIHRSVKPAQCMKSFYCCFTGTVQAPCMWPYCSKECDLTFSSRFKVQLLTVNICICLIIRLLRFWPGFFTELVSCNFRFSKVNTGSKITLTELRKTQSWSIDEVGIKLTQ